MADPVQTDPVPADPAPPGPEPVDPVLVGGMVPGPELAGVLAGTDLAGVDTYALVEAVAGWARLAAWVAAGRAGALAELSTRPELQPGRCGYRSVNPITTTALEVAARTVTTTRQAENLVGNAVQLVEDFPATWAALEAGQLDGRRVRVITGELGGQDPEVRRRVEAAVLPGASTMDTVALRRRITRLLHELAPVQTEQRCRAARERRDVTVTPAPDAMAYLEAHLPAEDAIAVKTVLDAAAHALKREDTTAGREPRTAGQRRADALAALAWTALDTQRIGPTHTRTATTDTATTDTATTDTATTDTATTDTVPADTVPGVTTAVGAGVGAGVGARRGGAALITLTGAQGRPVTVHVTFAFPSLIGVDDRPGDLDGYGPIPAHTARHLAAAGIWQWVRTHPASGHYVDHGRMRYRPTQSLIDHVVLRDRTCRTPG
ncbi:DUF222 domain-containing protein, partial [Jiangella asiatica]